MSSIDSSTPGAILRDPEVFVYELRPGCEAEYDRHHAAVWPEVIAELRGSGITEYTIHRRGSLVISVLRREERTPAPELSAEARRRVDEWHDLMAPLFAAVQDETGELLYAEKIFDISGYPATD
ncbi:L-rhamnose mutarotase [Microbacterium sp. LWO12-1.2]|uniref:L-rhamnose mutarotase n=1 Tax=Microbacterium sp. LWO12-1.2 TaxID=3135261 RepID=UPI00343468D3